jgi:hypothetical protein
MSSEKSDYPTITVQEVEKKKSTDDQQDVKSDQLKWNQVLPEKVKQLFWIVKESSSKLVFQFLFYSTLQPLLTN